MSQYMRNVGGKRFAFNPGKLRDGAFTEADNPGVASDAWSPVAYYDVPQGQAWANGRGQSYNPDKAEGFIYVDMQDTTPADMDGDVRLAVYNSANERVGTVYSNDTDSLRSGSATSADEPFPYQAVQGRAGEIGYPYKLALEFQADSGTNTFSLSDSTIAIDGFRGSRQN